MPVRAHARQGRAVAARHRPRRHRDPDGGRAAVDGAPAARPPRDGPREVPGAGLGMEGGVRRHHHPPAQAARRVVRLVARALHHGRGLVARGAQGVRRALPRRADLQGQAAGQLGPEAAHRDLRPRSAAGRGAAGISGTSSYPLEGKTFDPDDHIDLHHRRHHAAGDHAGRRRGRGASGEREAQAPDRQERDPAAGRPAHSDHRRRLRRSRRRAPAR